MSFSKVTQKARKKKRSRRPQRRRQRRKRRKSLADDGGGCLIQPDYETPLRGFANSANHVAKRLQNIGESHAENNEVRDWQQQSSKPGDDPSVPLNLLRGGGGKPKQPKKQTPQPKQKAQPTPKVAPSPKPQVAGEKPPKPEPAQRANVNKTLDTSMQPEELCANHWSVPVCREDELEHGKDGVALVSRAALQAKASVLAGSPSATAMLLNPNIEVPQQDDGSAWPLITVWVQKGGQVVQHTKRLVQCGTRKVAYCPTVAKGRAPTTQPMCTVVLEMVRSAFSTDQAWQKAATNASGAFQQYLSDYVKETEWADHKIKKCAPITRDNRTHAIAAYVRLPITLAKPLVDNSGIKASTVFARYFVSKECADPTPKLVNLWLRLSDFQQVKQKYLALPQDKVCGLAWSPTDFAVRVELCNAAAIAPMVTDRQCHR